MLWKILRRVWRSERGVVRLSDVCEAMFEKILLGVGVTFFVFYSCIFVHCYLLHVCKAAMADISPPYPSTQHTLSPRRLFLLP
jgi:hypothetical protein